MVDFAAEGLLDGLQGRAREARRQLLEELHADGVDLDELRQAVAEDALFLLPAERLIGGEARYTQREVAEQVGLDLELLQSLRRAQGLPASDPDARVHTETDLDAARTAAAFRAAGVRPEDMLEVTRILGRGLAQAAELMRAAALGLVLDPGADEQELAVRFAGTVAQLQPLVAPMVGQLLNQHLRHAVRSELLEAAERRTGKLRGAREMTVCFADLVGFTRMGEQVEPEELGAIAGRLEQIAAEVPVLPVRLVKTIGDAVMLVSPDTDALLDAGAELVARADAEGERFPQLRVGAARGPALSRAGDWYGRPVNLASRITALARPGSLLCTAEVREAADPHRWRWSFAGHRRVRGVREPVAVHRVRPAQDPAAG